MVTIRTPSAVFTVDGGFSGPAPYLKGYQVRFVAAPGNSNYRWQWGDGTPDLIVSSGSGFEATHTFAQQGLFQITLVVTRDYFDVAGGSCSATYTLPGLEIITPLCETQVLSGGQFQLNTRSGAISYVTPNTNCVPPVSFECLSEIVTIPHVIAASATAFTNQLVAAPSPAPSVGTPAANPYLQGQWQTSPQASYSFRTSLTPDPHNYSAGTFNLRAFDWEGSLRNRPSAWLTAAVTERTSPNGEVLQERDPLGVPSTAKFGYGKTGYGTSAQALPYLQAHNAEYEAVLFESFENQYSGTGEDGLLLRNSELQIVADQAHTGSQSALLQASRQLTLQPVPLTPQLNASGLLVKAWVRLAGYTDAQLVDTYANSTVELVPAGANTGFRFPLTSSVRTGEWLLFEARVPMNSPNGARLGDLLTPVLHFSNNGAPNVWVDDVRVQPREAQMTAYVYDPISLRLLASFDDQHFALRYQYNAEGKLIRKQVETEKGLKTLQETQYHTPSTDLVND
ncbi:PKD domain-containing protein [Hymenobacter sp. BT186]|uniref:PKD domain-containing protein n=1 Tax=Hymenobacter telluris TaxID=2816474 RepID=A0A939F3N6_9BACT|nr:PKD domain-containing protein [Hymenobacter telluris]MBO0360803.1 PKD domain-containing protein [Hymenobacter telluris]MBW3376832.1 PKD domain-containing protein [Hymenobacter norwichensis]